MSHSFTPIFRFPVDSPYSNILIKREDFSETGSHKFRYLENKMKALHEDKVEYIVISTTGNAGITACQYAKKYGIKVFCLMSHRGNRMKANQIINQGGFLVLTPRPIRFSKYIAKRYRIPLLRLTEDHKAPNSYFSLGEEIIAQAPDAGAIVNFATSGTSSLGIMGAYELSEQPLPSLHLVQHGRSCSIVKSLHPDRISDEEESSGIGLADTPHRDRLLDLIEQSLGDAWYVTEREWKSAEKTLQEFGLETSWEGVCSFFVSQQLKNKYTSLVCIFSGKKWPETELKQYQKAEGFDDMDRLWKNFLR